MRLLAVATGYSVALVAARRAIPFSLDSPWFVCLAMVCFLGLAFVARPLIPIKMPGFLRPVGTWEAKGVVYRWLRVQTFGTLLRRTPLRLLNRDVYLAGAESGAAGLRAQLEAAEASHFWAALLVVPYMALLLLELRWQALFWVALAQLAINVYPILHLRLTRLRLDRAFARRAAVRLAPAEGGRRRTSR